MKHRNLVILVLCVGLAVNLASCASVSPRVEVKSIPDDAFVRPERPTPGKITTQRDVARFLLELDAYSRYLEQMIDNLKKYNEKAP